MKMKMLGALALGSVLSPLASAATVDLTSGGPVYNIDLGGGNNVTMTVTASSNGTGANITTNGQGMGVDSRPGCCLIDDGALDNYNGAFGQDGSWEMLTFTFSGLVKLDSVELDNFEPIANADRHAEFAVNGGSHIDIDNNNMTDLGFSNWRYDYDGTAITSFSIATPDRSEGFASFRVNNLVVSEVPLPAAAWLFGSAVLGLGGMARRKRKQ